MSVLFISDLHLSAHCPTAVSLFKQFLSHCAIRAEALYILGDLFESWIGDDDDCPLADEIAESLSRLRDAGIPCYFMHGNRDFLVGNHYVRRAGLSLLADPAVITLYGKFFLLTHGDSLCTDDHDYQAFREKVRQLDWQQNFLAQPLQARREFARLARTESQRHTAKRSQEIMDVNSMVVIQTLAQHNVFCMIHGHTHRPAIHLFQVKQMPASRIVLGDWGKHGNMLEVKEDNAILYDLTPELQRIPLASYSG